MIKNKFHALLASFLWLLGCQTTEDTPATAHFTMADSLIQSVRQTYAPDQRVAVFSIRAQDSSPQQLMLKGETDQPAAYRALLQKLDSADIAYQDSVLLLPDATLGADTLGVVSISVANIRSQPKHAAELATQATMGMPLRILKKEGEWHLVQTPDRYISWIQGSFQPMNQAAYAAWQDKNKLIFTQMYGFAYQDKRLTQTASDLVAGNVFELLGEEGQAYRVRLPDGREAYVARTAATQLDTWLSEAETTEDALVNTAKQLLGIPYLWGGTSSKAADCSGFTKTVYFMNGKLLPRDASQQVHAGELVDDRKAFDKLRPGDLLFFGKAATDSTRERVTHVGMWIGNQEFIHAPGLEAHVRISSVDPTAANYDPFNLNRYLRTKRMIGSSQDIIALRGAKLF